MKKIILSLIIITFVSCNSNKKKDENYSKIEAYNSAERVVKRGLKSPKTAEFPSLSTKNSHVNQINKNEFSVDSWVDSQNSFGALIRTKFSCKVIFIKDKVKVEDLNFYQ